MRRPWLSVGLAGVATVSIMVAGVVAYSGTYGLNVILRRAATTWVAVKADDQRISASMRLSLQAQPPDARAGDFAWQQLERGFEVGELPVIAGGKEVERVLLARIDPAHFTFQVHNRPAGDRDAIDWMRQLGAVVIINGSWETAANQNGDITLLTPLFGNRRWGLPIVLAVLPK